MRLIDTVANQRIQSATDTARFMAGVYRWMAGGILLSAIIATYVASSPELLYTITSNRALFMGMMIGEIIMVVVLSAAINRLSAFAATTLFIAYAALNGVTLSILYMVYTKESIGLVFGSTAFAFAGLSLIGYTTKKDLGFVGTFCGMALMGMIGYALLSFIFPSMWSEQVSWWWSVLGVLVFSGLTAYDTQKLKQMRLEHDEGSEGFLKITILGALTLYLDFINLFLNILSLFGRRR